jgi:hypothetical protein
VSLFYIGICTGARSGCFSEATVREITRAGTRSDITSEIDVALKTLKSVKFWAKPIFLAKTGGASVALGGCTYGAFMVYFHSDERNLTSWFDWRAGTLGVMAAILTSVYVLRKLDSPKTEEEVKKN